MAGLIYTYAPTAYVGEISGRSRRRVSEIAFLSFYAGNLFQKKEIDSAKRIKPEREYLY